MAARNLTIERAPTKPSDKASEDLTIDQKCATIGQMFNRTTLTEEEVDDIYLTFLNGKCLN